MVIDSAGKDVRAAVSAVKVAVAKQEQVVTPVKRVRPRILGKQSPPSAQSNRADADMLILEELGKVLRGLYV